MPKKFNIYATNFSVVTTVPDTPSASNGESNSLLKGKLFIGVRLETLLLDQAGLYKLLGLTTKGEIPTDLKGVTIIQVSSFSEGASIGAFKSVSISLAPVDPAVVDPSFGPLYNTYICFSAALDIRDAADILYQRQFKGPTSEALYAIVPGSIKERRSRKFRPVAI